MSLNSDLYTVTLWPDLDLLPAFVYFCIVAARDSLVVLILVQLCKTTRITYSADCSGETSVDNLFTSDTGI